jgi:hypothetical protein
MKASERLMCSILTKSFMACAIVTIIAGCLETDAQQVDPPATPDRVESRRYLDLVKEADKLLAAGDMAGALRALQEADRQEFVELPNYDVIGRIGELQCRLGNKAVGESTLEDFECALAVASGELKCYREQPDRTQVPNPELAPSCFERMCSEIYLSAYIDISADNRRALEKQRQELEQARKVCAQ